MSFEKKIETQSINVVEIIKKEWEIARMEIIKVTEMINILSFRVFVISLLSTVGALILSKNSNIITPGEDQNSFVEFQLINNVIDVITFVFLLSSYWMFGLYNLIHSLASYIYDYLKPSIEKILPRIYTPFEWDGWNDEYGFKKRWLQIGFTVAFLSIFVFSFAYLLYNIFFLLTIIEVASFAKKLLSPLLLIFTIVLKSLNFFLIISIIYHSIILIKRIYNRKLFCKLSNL